MLSVDTVFWLISLFIEIGILLAVLWGNYRAEKQHSEEMDLMKEEVNLWKEENNK